MLFSLGEPRKAYPGFKNNATNSQMGVSLLSPVPNWHNCSPEGAGELLGGAPPGAELKRLEGAKPTANHDGNLVRPRETHFLSQRILCKLQGTLGGCAPHASPGKAETRSKRGINQKRRKTIKRNNRKICCKLQSFGGSWHIEGAGQRLIPSEF